eukprot:gnl/TRDRNA2_/TRDRNA2_88421_c0_seq1.p1 gnl/TRDRNA2_/TRDRNA2_88421_c0~~gnl/TRDRNA2_/TRDRNA2_88421_c0_seq1.p1  ORF type:complete len:275 (+),score=67.72 gnl/TRDRNA2_/TRDRNA2_88421_c0_seq1:67-891(+)
MAKYDNLPDCCPSGAEPLRIMADYKPKGTIIRMGDVECYVTWPEGAKCGVLVFQDMFGIHSGRHKQFCDMLAEKGYGAVAPDFTGKDPIVKNPPQFGVTCCCFMSVLFTFFGGGFARKTRALSWEGAMGHLVMDCVVPWMRQKGAAKLASVGFCWGSYGAMCCGKFPDVFSCNVSFHPSTEAFCKSTHEDDLAVCRAAKVPQLVVATSMESPKWKPEGAAQRACEEDGTKVVWLLEEKQKHGFMMRGDTSNEETRASVKKWMETMFGFFEANMK